MFPPGYQSFKCFLSILSFDVTYAQRRRINDGYSGTFTQTASLKEYGHGKYCFLLQFYKTIIGYRLEKISLTMNLYVIDIEML